MALASTRQPHLQGPVSVHAHRTKGVTGSEGWKEANEIGGGIGDRGGNGDGNGVEGGNVDGAGTTMEVKVNEGTQYGNRDWSGDGVDMGTGAGVETRGRTQDGNRDGGRDEN